MDTPEVARLLGNPRAQIWPRTSEGNCLCDECARRQMKGVRERYWHIDMSER